MTRYGNPDGTTTNIPARPILLALKMVGVTLKLDYGPEYDNEEINCVIEDVGEEFVYCYQPEHRKLRLECIIEVKVKVKTNGKGA